MKSTKKKVAGQQSIGIESDAVALAVTVTGGHMAPVTFYRNSNSPVMPYYISPWQEEKITIDEPVLRPLRGDFFCMPFGGDNTIGAEKHVAHGETATAPWKLENTTRQGQVSALTLAMNTRARKGTAAKRLMLHDEHNIVYCQHILEGFRGKMCLGHHATLAVGDKPDSLRFSSSPIRFGYTTPAAPGAYAAGEYFALASGARFRSLDKVPTIWKDKPFSDRSTFPAEEGFTDILAIFPKVSKTPAWNAAVMPRERYVWYALKDPSALPSTVLWMSNKGRHGAPWNGRNHCLGIEDVCAFFAHGLRESVKKNVLNEHGVATAMTLSPNNPTMINYLQGVVKVSSKFDRVKTIKFEKERIRLIAHSGAEAVAPAKWEFVFTGKLA